MRTVDCNAPERSARPARPAFAPSAGASVLRGARADPGALSSSFSLLGDHAAARPLVPARRHRSPGGRTRRFLRVDSAAGGADRLYDPKTVDGEERKPFVGFLPKFAADPPTFLTKAVMGAPPDAVVRLDLGPIDLLLFQHPDDIAHVLAPGAPYAKSALLRDVFSLLLGEGLVTAEGDAWRSHRRLASAAFQPQWLESFVDRFGAACEDFCARHIDPACDSPAERGRAPAFADAAEWAARLTFRIVAAALFSLDVESEDAPRFLRASTVAQKFIVDRIRSPLQLPMWLPLPRHAEFKEALGVIDGLVGRAIAERRARRAADRTAQARDLLDMLLASQDPETGAGLSDKELRDEVATLMLGGYETTTAALSWCLYYLATRPDVAARVRAEARAALGPAGRPAAADLPRMPYTACVIKEALRLRPPAFFFDRVATADDDVGGFPVRKGTAVCVSPLVSHRSPLFWEHPEAFDPSRFESDAPTLQGLYAGESKDRPRYAYLPFGGGPRVCIGQTFAMMELHVLVAMLARRYDFSVRPDYFEAGWDASGGIAVFPRGRSLPLRTTRAPL